MFGPYEFSLAGWKIRKQIQKNVKHLLGSHLKNITTDLILFKADLNNDYKDWIIKNTQFYDIPFQESCVLGAGY